MPLEPAPNPSPPPAPTTPTPSGLGAWLRRGGWRPLALGAVGAAAAGIYAQLVGCRTGGCALLSDVRSAVVAGALVGLALGWPSPPKQG